VFWRNPVLARALREEQSADRIDAIGLELVQNLRCDRPTFSGSVLWRVMGLSVVALAIADVL